MYHFKKYLIVGTKWQITMLFCLLILLFVPFSNACVQKGDIVPSILVSGPGDLYYMSVALNELSANGVEIAPLRMSSSQNSIDDLKSGRVDIAFIGCEPTVEDLQGLRDYVIALDAVCITIDARTYTGGIAMGGGFPLRKVDGFQNITSENLKAILSGQGWAWGEGYYVRNSGIDPTSWLWDVPSVLWVQEPKPIVSSFIFSPGKYDTQSVLYSGLGLDENIITYGRSSFTCPRYFKEEEVISYEYNSTAYSDAYTSQDFAFKMAFASRRAMTVAPKYVPIRVLAVDGIDPLVDPQSIYDGTYKFSRSIHLLIREKSPSEATRLVEFLQSAVGQQMVAEIGYLPVSQGQSIVNMD